MTIHWEALELYQESSKKTARNARPVLFMRNEFGGEVNPKEVS